MVTYEHKTHSVQFYHKKIKEISYVESNVTYIIINSEF